MGGFPFHLQVVVGVVKGCIEAVEVDPKLAHLLLVWGEEMFAQHYNLWICDKGGWVCTQT